jgi:glutamate/tyrosine decarboxylase-like PLP-dependent enzyme
MTEEQRDLFNLIKDQFFIDPAPEEPSTYVYNIQARLSVLIGNMLEWYITGASYTPLKDALDAWLDTSPPTADKSSGDRLARAEQLPAHSPLVIAENWDLKNIRLPFARTPYKNLKDALPIVDTDTGGAIRFNHHFIGELHPQGNILALVASIVAAFLNENAVVPKVSPSLTTWEKKVVNWMWHMLDAGKPGECGCEYSGSSEPPDMCGFELNERSGRIVAGGTIANLTALFIAREKFREWCAGAKRRPSDVSPVVLYSRHSHYSIRKAARIVGFTYDEDPAFSEIVPVDGRNYWYVTADDVARAIQNASARGQHVVMFSALAGTTDTGFVDDLDGIANVINEYNENPHRVGPRIYYHIDAAMGGPFRLLSSLKWKGQQEGFRAGSPAPEPHRPEPEDDAPLFNGIQRGDAITIDGHKYFYCNYPCGGIFVQREDDFNCLHEEARYLESGESEDKEPDEFKKLYRQFGLEKSPLFDLEVEWRDRRGLRTLEGSRGITGITQLYFTLKVFGPEGIGALLQHTLDMTKILRDLMKETRQDKDRPALELITSGPLNQTLFRVVTDWNKRTEPRQIDLDNEINFLIPHYANWTQTGKLQEEVKNKKGAPEDIGGKTNADIVKGLLAGHYSIPFYIGTDQLLDHLPDDKRERPRQVDAFLDYVWRINDEAEGGRCPAPHKLNIQRWLAAANANDAKKKSSLQVLKAIITHPYTDEAVLRKFVEDICEGAKVIQRLLDEANG